MLMKKAPQRGSPVPVRLDLDDHEFLQATSGETGLSVSDLMRRSVKLLRRHSTASSGFGFLVNIK
jgi:hypothetical protein